MHIIGEQTLEVMSTATWYNKWLLLLSKKYLGKKVLEIGAGIGSFTKLLSEDHEVTAVDINPNYLNLLKTNFKKISSGYGDIEKLQMPFKNKKFDSIICFNVLEHIKDDKLALSNMYKLLNSGGSMVLIVPAHKLLFSNFDKNIGHFRRYTVTDLSTKVEGVGFKINNIRYLNWVGALGWLVFLKVLGRSSLKGVEISVFNKMAPFLISFEKKLHPPFGLSVFCIAEKK